MDDNLSYEFLNLYKKSLLENANKTKQIINKLGNDSQLGVTEAIIEKLLSEKFKIIVLGEFKRGKSTFINAFLGDEVLPAYATPCTAVINEVKYSEEKRAVLYFKDNLDRKVNYNFKDELKEHIEKYSGGNIPPIEINHKDLEDFVVIPPTEKNQEDSVSDSPYEKVELFWPLKICKNGVEIIDSPGLNEHGTRTKVTVNYLSEVDAILFVTSCIALASQSEMEFINSNILENGHDSLFFIANRFDQVRKKERDRVKDYAIAKFAPKTKLGKDGIFMLSAIDALDGRLDENEEQLANSGILELESALEKFLIRERGKIKLLQTADNLKNNIDKLVISIDAEIKMSATDVEELKGKYKEIEPKLKRSNVRRKLILDKIENRIKSLKNEIKEDVKNYIMKDVTERLEKEIKELELKNKFKFAAFKIWDANEREKMSSQKMNEKMTKELADFTSDFLQNAISILKKKIIDPKIKSQYSKLKEEITIELKSFFDDISNIKDYLTGNKISIEYDIDFKLPDSVTLYSSIKYKNIKDALSKIYDNIKRFFRTATGKSFENTVKKEYFKIIKPELYKIANENSESFSKNVYSQSLKLKNEVDSKISNEISTIKQEVELALKNKRHGESAVKKRRKYLNNMKSELKNIKDETLGIIMEVNNI